MKLKHGTYAFIVLLLLSCLLSGQTKQWVYLYDGSEDWDDKAFDMVYGLDNIV